MNLGEMKSRGWWAIDDNESSPNKISATVMLGLINDAIRDLGSKLNIVKSATLTFTTGVASLPSDFISPVAVYDGNVILSELRDIKYKVANDATTSQFYIPNNTEIHIFGQTPEDTVTLWYMSHETALALDADIPANIPVQFHYAIPEIYVKAKYCFKNNRMGDYGGLMDLWEQVKRQIFAATNANRLAEPNAIYDYYGGDTA